MKHKLLLLLLGVVVTAFLIRVWQLGNVPASPDWDEVSLGYNAYSILHTGKDEYGSFLPLVLRSFDDYKPALYAYLIIPLLPIFDLTVIAVRLPSVIFGTLTVLALYFLTIQLLDKKITIHKKEIDSRYIALTASFLLAASPWHIQFSRIGFESNVGLAFNIFSFLLFLKGIKNPRFLLLAFAIGALNIHVYQSNRVFTPLLLLALTAIYWREVLRIKKWYISSLVIAAIIAFPFVIFTLTNKNALLRARGVSVFSEQTQVLARNSQKLIIDKNNHDIFGQILDNRRIEYGKSIIFGYISHYDLNWLFINGDISRHHAPNMGLLYIFELPLIFIGIYLVFFGNISKKSKLALLFYFLLVPIPASITTGVPHAVRTLNFVPVLSLFSGFGLLYFLIRVWELRMYGVRSILIGGFGVFAIFNFLYYLDQYFVQQNYYTSQDWQYGYKEITDFVKPIMGNYDKIVATSEQPWDQSYMFFLYYFKYDPQKYLASGGTESGGFLENHKGFLNIEFREIHWADENRRKTLFIGRSQDFPNNVKVLKTINYLNNQPSAEIVVDQ